MSSELELDNGYVMCVQNLKTEKEDDDDYAPQATEVVTIVNREDAGDAQPVLEIGTPPTKKKKMEDSPIVCNT